MDHWWSPDPSPGLYRPSGVPTSSLIDEIVYGEIHVLTNLSVMAVESLLLFISQCIYKQSWYCFEIQKNRIVKLSREFGL